MDRPGGTEGSDSVEDEQPGAGPAPDVPLLRREFEEVALPSASDDGADAPIRFFLIADVRGYTRFTQQHGDEQAARLAARFAQLTREVVGEHQGHLLELRGDEALVVFTSARRALRAAVALQRRYVDETIADPTTPLGVGIGLDGGEAVEVEGGYRGGALNLAARLCSAAAAGEIMASQELVHLARVTDGISYRSRGAMTFKGIATPTAVWLCGCTVMTGEEAAQAAGVVASSEVVAAVLRARAASTAEARGRR